MAYMSVSPKILKLNSNPYIMVLGAEGAGGDCVLRAESLCMGRVPSQKAPVSCLEETVWGYSQRSCQWRTWTSICWLLDF